MTKRSWFTLIPLAIILISYLPVQSKADDTVAPAVQVLVRQISGEYYHYDASCPMTYFWNYHFTLVTVQRDRLAEMGYPQLRPCPLCAAVEYEAYYHDLGNRCTPEEIAWQKKMDEVNLIRSQRKLVPLEDKVMVFPWLTVPKEGDISQDEAISIALDTIVSVYSLDPKEAARLEVHDVSCFPNVEWDGIDDLRRYLVQIGNDAYVLLYNVELVSTTGEVMRIERLINP